MLKLDRSVTRPRRPATARDGPPRGKSDAPDRRECQGRECVATHLGGRRSDVNPSAARRPPRARGFLEAYETSVGYYQITRCSIRS
ncbi:hypothetical protein EVAR_76606_1 [Eumeta japonica]|uniref:Uncharacterized protein n=1 Tax=Eumeta variegata TaxID=151549 RepID=A0A4C1T662_EUMVA|nr:hypothetical protein EVAR_76606_1 [Eumeta japonica]